MVSKDNHHKAFLINQKIKELEKQYGNDESQWPSDVLDPIVPPPSLPPPSLPPPYDGGKRRKTKITKKNKRSKIIGARCCTRRSRRISCRRGETALRR